MVFIQLIGIPSRKKISCTKTQTLPKLSLLTISGDKYRRGVVFGEGSSMFKNTFQSGFLSILYSIGSKPLQIWDKKVRNGHIKRITDPDIQVSN